MEAAAVSRRSARTPADEYGRRFVLVSGQEGGHRIESFPTEAEGRAAFIAARLRTSPRAEWAELVAVDSEGRLAPLSWFGVGSGATRVPVPRVVAVVPPAPRRWRRRRDAR
jgi:hypothetical protein